jgi:mRNA interferase HigB
MRIVSRKAIRETASQRAAWAASLNAWYRIAKNADWKNFAEVRNSWKNSDVVGRFVVFDISHNRCRLIATIKYKWRMVYIRHILSHAEYDEKEWQDS